MLAAMPSSISWSVGLGLSFSSATACIICPDWQYPRDIKLHPHPLDGVQSVGRDVLDGSDLGSCQGVHRRDAGPECLAILVDSTSAAQRDTAAELGSGQT